MKWLRRFLRWALQPDDYEYTYTRTVRGGRALTSEEKAAFDRCFAHLDSVFSELEEVFKGFKR